MKTNTTILWPFLTLTMTGFNFIKALRAAFTHADPKSAKKTVTLSIFFALLGFARTKAAQRSLMKLTTG
jgi:hypothetical protein